MFTARLVSFANTGGSLTFSLQNEAVRAATLRTLGGRQADAERAVDSGSLGRRRIVSTGSLSPALHNKRGRLSTPARDSHHDTEQAFADGESDSGDGDDVSVAAAHCARPLKCARTLI